MDIQRGKLFERIAVFVLGPSAAGKTYMSRLNLPNVLVANHFPIVPFVTIDGGTMRDVSENWNDMKSKCPADGFSDLFSGFFKSETGRFKMRLFHSLCRHGVNMLIPDTFADWVRGVRVCITIECVTVSRLRHSFISQENHSNSNTQMHARILRKLKHQRSNTGTRSS